MKKIKIYFILILIFNLSHSFGQNDDLKAKIENLKFTNSEFLNCDSDYWKIIAYQKIAIPYLIEKLNDEHITNAKYNCKTENLKVGDIAYLALNEILNIPLFEVTNVQFDWFENNGCRGGLFNYIENNRNKFKEQVDQYYLKNKLKLKFVKFKKRDLTKCRIQNKINGYFKVE